LTPLLPEAFLEQVLGKALSWQDVTAPQVEMLKVLAPRLKDTLLEGAIKAVKTWPNKRNQAQALVVFLPYVSEQTSLLKSIRHALLDYLLSIQHKWRLNIFDDIQETIVLFNISSDKMINVIASHVVEISQNWYWL